MPNRWIEHVKQFAKDKNISYACAMTDPDLKKGYVATGDKKRKPEKLEMAVPSTEPKAKNIVIQPRPAPKPKKMDALTKYAIASKARKMELKRQGVSVARLPNADELAKQAKEAKSAGGASKTYFGIDLSKYKEPYKAPPQPPKAPEPEPAPKKKRGIQEYEILNRQGMRDLFDRYYNSGDDEFRWGTLYAPNGQRYSEDDFRTFTNSFGFSKKAWKEDWKPLAVKLKKEGYITF